MTSPMQPRLALVLGGGAARGLAHLGVLEVLEREGTRPAAITGSSMGGLVAALTAVGLSAREIQQLARRFRFPRWFIPGGLVEWDRIFPSAVEPLRHRTFDELRIPLSILAVDLEAGTPVVLDHGSVLDAARATCAVPGVLPPQRVDGRWLVDGGLINLLPVDLAWAHGADIVVGVSVSGSPARRMPQLEWRITSLISRLGRLVPNPATAKVAFEVLVRATEVALARSTTLAAAMSGPELLIEVDVDEIGLRDFHRLDEAVERGRRAAEAACPALKRLLEQAPRRELAPSAELDPVCCMMVSPSRARADAEWQGRHLYFCSPNCRDAFLASPERYLAASWCRGIA